MRVIDLVYGCEQHAEGIEQEPLLEVAQEFAAAVGSGPPRPRAADGEPAVPAALRTQLADYYRLPAVRARILEFLGASGEREP